MMSKDVSTRQRPVSMHYLGERGRRRIGQIGMDKYALGRIYQTRYFQPYCASDKVLLDFGCGDGSFLRHLSARQRIGIEVNPSLIEKCREQSIRSGIEVNVHESLEEIESASVDIVISNHCLEHVLSPYTSLQQIHRILRANGSVVIVVPFDDFRIRNNRVWLPKADGVHPLSPRNMNHLHTWSPMNLGNLMAEAGFEVIDTRVCTSAWSPRFFWVAEVFGVRMFDIACHFWGLITRRREVFCHAISGQV